MSDDNDFSCCPLTESDGDGPEFMKTTVRTARKPRRCYECSKPIAPGQQYEYVRGKWDGAFSAWGTCLPCVSIRQHFAACGDSWCYGTLWDDIMENLFPTMSAGGQCLAGMPPEAKDKLFTVFNEWVVGPSGYWRPFIQAQGKKAAFIRQHLKEQQQRSETALPSSEPQPA